MPEQTGRRGKAARHGPRRGGKERGWPTPVGAGGCGEQLRATNGSWSDVFLSKDSSVKAAAAPRKSRLPSGRGHKLLLELMAPAATYRFKTTYRFKAGMKPRTSIWKNL